MKNQLRYRHKPVVVSENYEKIDGQLARSTASKCLSLDVAQRNDRGKVDISAMGY